MLILPQVLSFAIIAVGCSRSLFPKNIVSLSAKSTHGPMHCGDSLSAALLAVWYLYMLDCSLPAITIHGVCVCVSLCVCVCVCLCMKRSISKATDTRKHTYTQRASCIRNTVQHTHTHDICVLKQRTTCYCLFPLIL